MISNDEARGKRPTARSIGLGTFEKSDLTIHSTSPATSESTLERMVEDDRSVGGGAVVRAGGRAMCATVVREVYALRDSAIALLLIAALGWGGGGLESTAYAQGSSRKSSTTKKSTASKSSAAKKVGAGEPEAPLPFDEVEIGAEHLKFLDEGATQEFDELPEGKSQLKALLEQTRKIFTQRDRAIKNRSEYALPRDRIVGEIVALNDGILQAQQGILQTQNEVRRLQRLIMNGDNQPATQNLLQVASEQIDLANILIVDNQQQIARRTPKLNALNRQIEPYESKLRELWIELNNCRKQWIEIRQPLVKYSQGNYEQLKSALDEWILADASWPVAHSWAALCEYELGNFDVAWMHVERASELRPTLNLPALWPQGDALRGLIAAQMSDRKSRSATFLQSATSQAGRDKDNWMTHFLLGRAAMENSKFAVKARTHFEKALKIDPDAMCVNYWYGRLKVTTTNKSVQDVASGTEFLERLWKHSTKQSWRLAQSLVLAYDAAGRDNDAKLTWELVEQLAPRTAIEDLHAERDDVNSARAAAASKAKGAK